MTIQHLTPSDYITTKWSGGLTTQLGIAPAGAVYADRDFLWRLSSATVEDAESDFTALPDYERLISTLEGTIELNHNGGEKLRLNRRRRRHALLGPLPRLQPHAPQGQVRGQDARRDPCRR